MSQSAVIQAIANFGPISRASVAKITGLSKQTVSEIVMNLEGDGWVRTVGHTEGHIGRRAVVYEISPSAATIASVDLGGTKVRVALCDLTGVVLAEQVEPTAKAGGSVVVDQIATMIKAAALKAGIPLKDLHIAVIGVPGVPDQKTGAVMMAPNIAGIDQVDIPSQLKELLGIEVFVENDVSLAALGEHWLGKHGESDSLVYLSIGTGIGSGIVIGGNLLRGNVGAAGEVGFLPFGADPFDPESRRVGALERVTATNAIIEQYEKLTGRQLSVPDVFEAANRGDEAAAETLNLTAREIARAVAAIAAIIDPSAVIMGGSIGTRPELLERVAAQLELCFPRPVVIQKSELGNYAALAGGASIALAHLHVSLFAEGQKGAEITVPAPALESFKAGRL
ncbi:ROK family transcriptional regulator [uncultured Cohaesibacter sp.]|uniref:ROK family transcriptional regulator n=1 Tax=uncultured Cohaesibacter sp. TaxID=1002546 RepID=UPI0029C9AF2B|nr:ROK family transcriptional regulator [uncultured Cohaesibacter sp.]